MVRLEKIKYLKFDSLRLYNEAMELVITVQFGPRILVCRRLGGVNFMKNFEAESADFRTDEWQSYGGHRLWHAPEVFPRTYYPDIEPVAYEFKDDILYLNCAVESTTGLQKTIAVKLDPAVPKVELIHTIFNRNAWGVEFSPWCLTVMAAGGRAVIPQEPFVPHGKGPGESFALARPLVLWQFTRMNDPRFVWGDRLIQIRQDDKQPSKQKIGLTNTLGWAAYALNNETFVKHFPFDPNAAYPDVNCNCEFFTMPGFLEIESLGPLRTVEPGGSIAQTEIWELHNLALATDEPAMVAQLTQLGLPL